MYILLKISASPAPWLSTNGSLKFLHYHNTMTYFKNILSVDKNHRWKTIQNVVKLQNILKIGIFSDLKKVFLTRQILTKTHQCVNNYCHFCHIICQTRWQKLTTPAGRPPADTNLWKVLRPGPYFWPDLGGIYVLYMVIKPNITDNYMANEGL